MIPIETLSAFTLAAVLLAFAPGPDNIFVLAQSAMYGRRAGIMVVLGLCTGLIFHTAAVALGVAALLKASATAFTVLKIVGACYLLYLAWGAFRASASKIDAKGARLGDFALYRRGVIMNITNPKVAIFFLAFFPQFTDPAAGGMIGQIAQLGIVFIVSTFFVFGGIAVLSGYLNAWFAKTPSAQGWLNKIAGVVFVGLAAKLATSKL